MDVETAFLQALGFTRRIYVRPPREAGTPYVLCLLELAAYGLTDSGRLWCLTSNKELIQSFGLTRSPLDYTVYYSESIVSLAIHRLYTPSAMTLLTCASLLSITLGTIFSSSRWLMTECMMFLKSS